MDVIEAHGAKIPVLGLGTWQLRGAVCARIVEQALRLGYRHIDTAQIYENEREVGEGVRASGVKRQSLFITTKVWPTNFSPPALERSVKESLTRLRMTDVDLVLLHWPSNSVPLEDTMPALCEMKREGYTRHIGVSNFDVSQLAHALRVATEPIVTNQLEIHPYMDQPEVIAACRNHGVAVTAYSPIARGNVTGDSVLAEIGERHGKSAAQVSLRFLVQLGMSVIPRTSRRERLEENMAIFDFSLSNSEMRRIEALRVQAEA